MLKNHTSIETNRTTFMSVFIKSTNGNTFTFDDIDPNKGAAQIKEKLYQSNNIPIESQRLCYAGKMLDDSTPLSTQFYDKENNTYWHSGSISLVIRDLLEEKKSTNSSQLMPTEYKTLEIEFRQYLSETTQKIRHEKGHISTEAYWITLSKEQQNELYQNFMKNKKNDSKSSSCTIM